MKYYFTGKPCIHGHLSKRQSPNKNCYMCSQAARTRNEQELWPKAIKKLGNQCAKCGFDKIGALQIDHVNGGGCQFRKTSNLSKTCRLVLKEEGNYQVLCANCNWIKRYTNNELGIIPNPQSKWAKIRKRVFNVLGHSCVHCGQTDKRCLQVDHKNDGGTVERKRVGDNMVQYRALKEPHDFQILCANCNWLKRSQR